MVYAQAIHSWLGYLYTMRKKRVYGEYDMCYKFAIYMSFPLHFYVNKEKYMSECRLISSLESDTTASLMCGYLLDGFVKLTYCGIGFLLFA